MKRKAASRSFSLRAVPIACSTAWHSAIFDAARPLLAAARGAGAVRPDLDLMELMALTAAVARAGDPAQAGRFLDILLEGIIPRPAAEHAADPSAVAPQRQ
jgi:hypothetical protein